MKKIIALFLMIAMLIPGFAMAQTAPFVGYKSDFSKGTDGWVARSTGGAVLSVTEDGLLITGRSENWNSPGREFAFIAGSRYEFSFKVKQDQVESADFMVSMAHSRDGVESYENLCTGTAIKGEWATLKGSFAPDAYDQYILYVETISEANLDFVINEVEVEPMGIVYDTTLPSLAELYAPYFDLGIALNQGQSKDVKRMDFCAGQFNILTHENELKPDSVLDVFASSELAKEDETAVAVRFGAAKPMLDFCKENGIKVHGHTLVWHNQTPDVFFREGYKASGEYVSRDVMLARLENYIRLVFEYTEQNYPGLIVSWDVVNEAVADNSTTLRQSNWTKVVGDDFVNRAFEIARKYAPKETKLFYNDYSTPYEPKQTGIYNLLESLVKEGNIDGYGFQCHFSAMGPAPSSVRKAMERFAGLGLRLRVSELDVGIKSTSDLDYRIQAYRYADLFKVFVEMADHLDAVQIWGLTDDRSWRSGEYPLLFDNKARPKPAFYSVVDVLKPAAE